MKPNPNRREFFVPISKTVDNADGSVTISGIATEEILDSQGEIMDYQSIKACFEEWFPIGNIREQHDVYKAVGVALEWEPFDETKQVGLTSLISSGAPDTVQKIHDKVLKGYSVVCDVARRFEGGRVMLYAKKLNEVSVVDSPAVPTALFTIAKSTKGDTMADETKDIAMLEQLIAALEELKNKEGDEKLKLIEDIKDVWAAVLEHEKGGEGEEKPEGKPEGKPEEKPEPNELEKRMEALKQEFALKEEALKEEFAAKAKELNEKCNEKCGKAAKDAETAIAKAKADAAEEVEKVRKSVDGEQAKVLKSVNENLEKVMKSIRQPGTPITKGEGDTNDLEGIPEELTTAIKACGGDKDKIGIAVIEWQTKMALATRKEGR